MQLEKNCLTTYRIWLVVLTLTSHISTFAATRAIADQTHPWLNSGVIATQQKLSMPYESSVESRLDDLILKLNATLDVQFFLHREIAKDSIVILKTPPGSIESLIEQSAEQVDAKVIVLNGIVLLAPSSIAETLAKHYWELTFSGPRLFAQVSKTPLQWRDGSDMKMIANQLCDRLKIENSWVEDLDHDLWSAFQFRNQSEGTVAFCVLANMYYTLRMSDDKWSATPIDRKEDATVTWSYTNVQIEKLGPPHCKAWKEGHADAVIERTGNQFAITALPSSHRDFIRPLIPPKKWPSPRKTADSHSGILQGSLGYILNSLRSTFKLEFTPSVLPESVAMREVRLEFKNASLDQILIDLGIAAHVEFKRLGNQCEILVKEAP